MNVEKKNVSDQELLSELFETPDPPFTNSYGSSICWRKQPDLLQKLNLLTRHFGLIAFWGQYKS